ncbi:hypothetical protein ACWATR_27665 [Nostoc sp. UIC 10890]
MWATLPILTVKRYLLNIYNAVQGTSIDVFSRLRPQNCRNFSVDSQNVAIALKAGRRHNPNY